MKIRNADLVPAWANSPEAFAQEPQHVQEQYRAEVEAYRRRNAVDQAEEEAPRSRKRA